MIEYLTDNLYAGWFTIGFILLAVEMLVFGFSTGFMLFIGLGALLTGGLIWLGIIPDTWIASVACFGVSSAVISILLYSPMKKLQNRNKEPEKDTSSDLIGLEFRLEKDISSSQLGIKKYSGVEWKIEIAKEANLETISAGTLVAVVTVDVALFRVKPI